MVVERQTKKIKMKRIKEEEEMKQSCTENWYSAGEYFREAFRMDLHLHLPTWSSSSSSSKKFSGQVGGRERPALSQTFLETMKRTRAAAAAAATTTTIIKCIETNWNWPIYTRRINKQGTLKIPGRGFHSFVFHSFLQNRFVLFFFFFSSSSSSF